MVLIVGPPGCGKLETVRLLCSELDIYIHTWEEQIRYESAAEWEYKQGTRLLHLLYICCFIFKLKCIFYCIGNPSNQDTVFEERMVDLNPLNHLRDFMKKVNRYQVLKIREGNSSASGTQKKKLLLIKDLPAMVHKNLDIWHDILM